MRAISPLLFQLGLAATMLLGVNIAIARLSQNTIPRQHLRALERSHDNEVLFVGNSQMADAIHPEAFVTGWPGSHPLNMGIGATLPVEHLQVLSASLDKVRPKIVCYGFFDLQLNSETRSNWQDVIGNRALTYYVRPDIGARNFDDNLWRKAVFRLIATAPLLRERSLLWARVNALRADLAALGMPHVKAQRDDPNRRFAQLETQLDVFTLRSRQVVADEAPMAWPVRDMLQDLCDRQIPLYVVEMPIPSAHRRTYYETPAWAEYRAYVRQRIAEKGGYFIEASAWVEDSGFADNLHLNKRGAADFSRRLAAFLANSTAAVTEPPSQSPQ